MGYKEGAGRQNYEEGSQKDICQTPGYALEPLQTFVPLGKYQKVWEPACGEAILARQLGKTTSVIGTDISGTVSRDFLSWELNEKYDAIITNPPFANRIEFMERCIELGKPWALLMPTETVSLKSFIELVKGLSPRLGIVWFAPRVNFKMPHKKWEGSAYFPVAWFTWNMGFEGNKFKLMGHWNKEYRKNFEH